MKSMVSLALSKSFLLRTFELFISFDETLYVIGFFLGYTNVDDTCVFASSLISVFISFFLVGYFFCSTTAGLVSLFFSNNGFGAGRFLLILSWICFSDFLKIDGFFCGNKKSVSE